MRQMMKPQRQIITAPMDPPIAIHVTTGVLFPTSATFDDSDSDIDIDCDGAANTGGNPCTSASTVTRRITDNIVADITKERKNTHARTHRHRERMLIFTT